ncbi:MAG: hypothetical protein NTZ87_02800 [Candidatus Nomurabacteria bacterium]|nr:hypothetical protein [Candidatus Nomurabacteria bacterium]
MEEQGGGILKRDFRKVAYEKAIKKAVDGPFALNAKDHLALGSTPSFKLKSDSEKALHELLSDTEIEGILDEANNLINDRSVAEYIKESQRDFLLKSIPFLRRIGKLPEKYKNVQI